MTDFEREDMELSEMMGGRFTDMTKGEEPGEKPAEKPCTAKQRTDSKKYATEETAMDAKRKPVKPAPDFMDKLRQTAKDVCLYAALSLILFWWQQTGRLEEQTAWYALLVCVGMVFFAVGKNWRGWCE